MKDKPRFERIFVCSPYRGDTVTNAKNARKYCRFVEEHTKLPIAPHIYFTQFLDDKNPVERMLGLIYGMDLLMLCGELWIFGDRITEGMRMEIDRAKDLDIPIMRLSDKEVDEFLKARGITL